ncbi:polysaccharide biosynthesis/export family protein [Pseudooceanicola sp.]|uniref:polysaccharide biosynthesis/export family protein n=1 Tax=Pseudooceanicola sp. TaxID=1914328 RepID=UPI0035C6DBF8
MSRWIAALALSAMSAPPVGAEGYRLVPGDELTLEIAAREDPLSLTVDLDGQIRVAGLGGLAVSGQTLDQAEAQLAEQLEAQGLYVSPQISLSVVSYAPVLVAGDVQRPGRVDFLPGMRVASAVALAGGGQVGGLSRADLARLRSEAEAGRNIANLDLAAQVARIARLEAQIDGPDTAPTLSPEARTQVPLPGRVDLDALLMAEAAVLRTQRDRTAELLAFWDEEVQTIAAQRANFDQRIAVQTEILASARAELERARDLSDRGLQTAPRLAAAEQREADARRGILELEAARITAARATSAAERERVQFLATQRESALTALAEARHTRDSAALRYQRFAGLLAVLTGGEIGALMDSGVLVLSYDLQSPRPGRPPDEVTRDTPLLPGETLVVTVQARLPDGG